MTARPRSGGGRRHGESATRRRRLIGLGLLVLVVHNLEELVTVAGFLERHRSRLPLLMASMTAGRFSVSLAVVTALFFLATWFAMRDNPRRGWVLFTFALHAGMAVNALQHAAVAAMAGGYAPGVVTGLLLYVPYSVHLVRAGIGESWVNARHLLLASVSIVVLTPFLLAAIHLVSGLLV